MIMFCLQILAEEILAKRIPVGTEQCINKALIQGLIAKENTYIADIMSPQSRQGYRYMFSKIKYLTNFICYAYTNTVACIIQLFPAMQSCHLRHLCVHNCK